MELWLPDQIVLDGTSKALIGDVEEIARLVNEYRPLPPPVIKRIEEELLGERVYSSNAIEGNTLDLRETVMILRQGLVGTKRKREAMEARNLGDAAKKITEWVDNKDSCHTSEKLLEIHGIVLGEVDDQWAGKYREHRVMIGGAVHQPPQHALVAPMIDRVMEALARTTGAGNVLMGTWVHWAIARIHPFHDGNGRMARLWQDLVLSQGGFTCAIIRPEDRREYLEALGQSDEGDFNPLVRLIAQRVSVTFDKYLAEIRREEQLGRWVEDLVGEVDVRIEEHRTLSYLRWSRKMEQLRWEFEVCASRITDASKEMGVQVLRYDLIDQVRWENLRAGLGAERAWFFIADFSRGGTRWRYYFFFGRHHWSDLDDERDRSEQRVGLLISEQRGSAELTRLDEADACPISLREIFVVDESFVRKRVKQATVELEYERGVSPLRIAQDFMHEVVLHRLT